MQRLAISVALLLAATTIERAEAQTSAPPIQSIAETHWSGETSAAGPFPEAISWTLYFRSDGVLVYSVDGVSHDNGHWRQRGLLVTFETNDYHAVAVGAVRGDALEGVAYNRGGEQTTWTFRRLPADAIGPLACPQNMVALRGAPAALVCICPQSIDLATVWGDSAAYTDDSHICTAAVHAGAVTAQAGGTITVTPRPGQESYPSSTLNGVTTLEYGPWQASYAVSAASSTRKTQ